eukprot:417299-Ditylum_brightwellii.AAC.1
MAIIHLLKDPTKFAFLNAINVSLCNELGQVSAELLSTIDIILCLVRESNTFMGAVLLTCTMDHIQMVALKNSVGANSDENFKRIQDISMFHHMKFSENP